MSVPEITVKDLKAKLDAGETPFILDVRQPEENAVSNIDGVLIPLKELPMRMDEIDGFKNQPVYVHCRSGGRSGQAAKFLRSQGYDAYNVKGGMKAWAAEIDPDMQVA
ncbi:MAG: rhodanese-like domain-containing protein [Bacteroidota bacterium]